MTKKKPTTKTKLNKEEHVEKIISLIESGDIRYKPKYPLFLRCLFGLGRAPSVSVIVKDDRNLFIALEEELFLINIKSIIRLQKFREATPKIFLTTVALSIVSWILTHFYPDASVTGIAMQIIGFSCMSLGSYILFELAQSYEIVLDIDDVKKHFSKQNLK